MKTYVKLKTPKKPQSENRNEVNLDFPKVSKKTTIINANTNDFLELQRRKEVVYEHK